ncbi:hypothetical protein GGR51DRAFT_488009 [Nemania sp. FL0031]|nr:hypothetical protein GGR51DRAFT_488009 [Nemania sp. FL0031]
MPCQTRSQTSHHSRTGGNSEARSHTRNQTRCRTGVQSRYRARCPTRRSTKHRTRREGRLEAKPPLTFNQLPPEIRFMIWEEFIRTPRIIHIDLLAEDPLAYPGYTVKMGDRATSYTYYKCRQVCPLLGVSRESRRIAMTDPPMAVRVAIPVITRRRFQPDIEYHDLAIRRHDFVFFKGSETWRFNNIGHAFWHNQSFPNIIIDMDVRSINYHRICDATLDWVKLISNKRDILWRLGDRQGLNNFYCLIQDQKTDKKRHFELDDLCELTPGQFPKYGQNLTTWLEAFAKLPEEIRRPHVSYYLDEDLRLIERWKNVTVGQYK